MFYFMVANLQLYLYCLGAFVFMENIILDGFEKNVVLMGFCSIIGAVMVAMLVKKGLTSMLITVNQMKEDIIRSHNSIRDEINVIGKIVRSLDDGRRGEKEEVIQSHRSMRDEVDDKDLSIPNGSDEQRRWNVGEDTHISKGETPVKDDFTGMMVTKGNRPKILKEEDLENPVALYMQSMENKEKCTVKVILDSGANTMVTPHTNILWDRTSTSKVIGTAEGRR